MYKCVLIIFVSISTFSTNAQKADAAYINSALSFLNAKQYDKAIEYCNKALEFNPSNATAYDYRGFAYRNLDNNTKALADFNQAIRILPTYDNAYLQRALVYSSLGNKAMAIADNSKAIALNPKNVEAYFNRGSLYHEKENYTLAILDFTQAITISPDFASYYVERGRSYAYQKKYDLAITDYSKAIALVADYSFAFLNRGIAYVNKGNNEQALVDYNNAIKSNPNYSAPYRYRGDLNYNNKKYEFAIKDYSEALKFDAKDFYSYEMRASSYAMTNKYDLALSDLNLVIQADPTNTNAYVTRGWTLLRMEKFDDALKDLNIALAASPKNVIAIVNRGWTYKAQGKYDLAMEDFEMAIQIDPANPDGYSGRGALKFYKGEPEMAIVDLTKALELNPENGAVYGTRSSIYYFLGNYTQSIKDNKEAIRIDATDPYPYIDLMTNFIRIGDIESAKIYNQKFKSSNLKITQASSWKFYDHYVTAMTEGVLTGSYDLALKELKAAEEAYSTDISLNSTISDERKYGYIDILFLEGYVLEKLEKYNEAKVDYEQALIIDKNQTDLKSALQRIEDRKVLAAQTDTTPPEIELRDPKPTRSFEIESDEEKMKIVGKVTDPSGIADVKVMGETVVVEPDGMFITKIALKPGSNVINIEATDKRGNKASKSFKFLRSATVSDKRDLPASSTEIKPIKEADEAEYHAILIAEQTYEDKGIKDLENPVQDAKDLKAVLETYYTFKPENIDTLFDRSKNDITNFLFAKCNNLKPTDNMIIFFAGHGEAVKDNQGHKHGFLIPSNAIKGNLASYIDASEFIKAMGYSKSNHILLIVDACYSGDLTRGDDENKNEGPPAEIQAQYDHVCRKIMTSGNDQPVSDVSVFLKYLKQNLIANKEKYLTSKKLFDSFYGNVINETVNKDDKSKKPQQPLYVAFQGLNDDGGEFVFVKK